MRGRLKKMNLKDEEKAKIQDLKDKVKLMKPEEVQAEALMSIAESLIIIAHKLGRKML